MNYIVAFSTFWVMQCFLCTPLNDRDVSPLSVYFDPRSGLPLRIVSIQNSLSDSAIDLPEANVNTKSDIIRRVGFRSNGCTCQELTCGCCLGLNIQQFSFSREGCMNFSYDPYQFAISMKMFMNNNPIYSNQVSAKNPPPLCVPVPIPYLPMVDFCAKLYDIHTPGQNLHMCLDVETRIQQASVLVLHFDCMRMGTDGVSLVKPDGNPTAPVGPIETSSEPQIDSDVFDEVTETKYNTKKPIRVN